MKFNNRKVPNDVVSNILAPMMLYVGIFSIGSIIMSFIGVDFMTAIGSVAATLGNVGPGEKLVPHIPSAQYPYLVNGFCPF